MCFRQKTSIISNQMDLRQYGESNSNKENCNGSILPFSSISNLRSSIYIGAAIQKPSTQTIISKNYNELLEFIFSTQYIKPDIYLLDVLPFLQEVSKTVPEERTKEEIHQILSSPINFQKLAGEEENSEYLDLLVSTSIIGKTQFQA